jgi:SAM-dependent methyltransferase/uncharacterized protein YbaR (Trm112 family)
VQLYWHAGFPKHLCWNEGAVVSGFPISAINHVYCPHDGGELDLKPDWEPSDRNGVVKNGTLECCECLSTFAISEGILEMLEASALDAESGHELELREKQYGPTDDANKADQWASDQFEKMEIDPTVDALSSDGLQTLLELGCGDGRFTISLVDQFKLIVALDFSLEALRRLGECVGNETNVALVHADISKFQVRPHSFDRVLSTLTSNLPTPWHREAMFRLAASAVSANGRFIFSTHNHGFWQHVRRQKKSDRYERGGIFRHNMTARDCKSEASRFFHLVEAWPINISLPLSGRFGLPAYRVSRALEQVPFLGYFGKIVLGSAEKPR